MSADLTIDRLSATVLPAETEEQGQHAAAAFQRVVDTELGCALRTATLPPGNWYVRRHMVSLVAHEARSQHALAGAWARDMVASLQRVLRNGSDDVVRYDSEADAMVDAVVGVASGRLDRLWAWQRAGVLPPQSAHPGTDPAGALLALLRAHPASAARLLSAAASKVPFTHLHRVLGESGWKAAAELVRAVPTPASDSLRAGAVPPFVESLARRLVLASSLADRMSNAKVRPTPATLDAWTVLVVEEVDPTAARSAEVLATVRAELARLLSGTGRARLGEDRHLDQACATGATRGSAAVEPESSTSAWPKDQPLAAQQPWLGRSGPGPTASSPGTVDAGPGIGSDNALTAGTPAVPLAETGAPDERTSASPSEPTRNGGLFFFLSTAEAADIPVSTATGSLAGRPLPWVVHHVVQHMDLGVDRADPAALGVAGLGREDGEWLLRDDLPEEWETEQLRALATHWKDITLQRLEAACRQGQEAIPDLMWLVSRPAEVCARPGWLEVVFTAATADALVRRAGLDIDPGWLPWLGCVVRYRYE